MIDDLFDFPLSLNVKNHDKNLIFSEVERAIILIIIDFYFIIFIIGFQNLLPKFENYPKIKKNFI